jgi:hypothetical protein
LASKLLLLFVEISKENELKKQSKMTIFSTNQRYLIFLGCMITILLDLFLLLLENAMKRIQWVPLYGIRVFGYFV